MTMPSTCLKMVNVPVGALAIATTPSSV